MTLFRHEVNEVLWEDLNLAQEWRCYKDFGQGRDETNLLKFNGNIVADLGWDKKGLKERVIAAVKEYSNENLARVTY